MTPDEPTLEGVLTLEDVSQPELERFRAWWAEELEPYGPPERRHGRGILQRFWEWLSW